MGLIRSALVVSRCKGLCRLGKWLLRRLRVRVVLLTDKDGKELNKYMNYFAEVVLFDATFWQDISPRKVGFLLKDFPDKNVAIFNLTYMEPEKAALFIRYGAKSYFDMSGSGSFWKGLKTVLRGKQYITPSVRKALEDMPDCTQDLRLDTTGRMDDVKLLIFKGLRTKEIADVLLLSIRTVENHKTALFATYGVKSSIALFRQCFLLGELNKELLTA
jgi:DNA-binding CsgD family transcriptional regulator